MATKEKLDELIQKFAEIAAQNREYGAKVTKNLAKTINSCDGVKLPEELGFIVEGGSFIVKDSESNDKLIHVQGYFRFSKDLSLLVTGDGVLDYKRNKKRDSFDVERNFHYFKVYEINAEVQTSKQAYLDVLSKFKFPLRVRFENGKAIIEQSYGQSGNGYTDMFSQIRSLRHVHVIEDFVRLGTQKELDEAEKTLKNEIKDLGIDTYPIEYETLCCDISGNEEDKFDYTSFATAKYEDSNTGVGFEISFSPGKIYHPNPKIESHYSFVVTIPADLFQLTPQLSTNLPALVGEKSLATQDMKNLYKKVQEVYNEEFDTPNITDCMDEDIIDMEASHYAVDGAKKINYILGDKEEFLGRAFERNLEVL